VGWRDRDWAKFTGDDWDAIYGFEPNALQSVPRRRRVTRQRARRLAELAIGALVVAAIGFFAYQHRPATTHAYGISPMIPFTPAKALPIAPARSGTITGSGVLHYGGGVMLSGSHPSMTGVIRVLGRWNGSAWQTLGTLDTAPTTYRMSVQLTERGRLQVRIVFPNGYSADRTYSVS